MFLFTGGSLVILQLEIETNFNFLSKLSRDATLSGDEIMTYVVLVYLSSLVIGVVNYYL